MENDNPVYLSFSFGVKFPGLAPPYLYIYILSFSLVESAEVFSFVAEIISTVFETAIPTTATVATMAIAPPMISPTGIGPSTTAEAPEKTGDGGLSSLTF